MRGCERLWVVLVIAVLLAAFGAVSPASADTITFDLTVPDLALVGFPAPYATVQVNRTSTTSATITFTGDTSGAFTYFFGAAQAIDVNVNAASFSVSGVTVGTLGAPTSGNVNGFGFFNLVFDNSDGFSNKFSPVSFTLTDLSGTWATASAVLTPNAGGSTAAAHIFATSTQCTGACVTGFAGNGSVATPEPSTLLLAGSGLIGAGAWARRRLRELLPV